jgi:ketosteroid isomerase-like protein
MMINAVAVVQEFYRAMGAGDVEHIAALLSPDLEWTGAESFPYYSGLWRGPQAVIDNLLLPLARDWDGFSATRTNFSLATSVSRAALARAGQTAAMA